MFPLEHGNELLYQELSSILQQDFTNLVTKISKKRQRTSKSDENELESNKSKLRKIMHRDMERQRRQEMNSLCVSLRDLLPLEYIKGKRSISDHMNEAANYIKDMERNIKELRLQRDKLKNISISPVSENGSLNSSVELPNCVTVNSCWDGVEILINCGMKKGHEFLLSTVIMELLQTGLDIVSCISTKLNGRFLYQIKSEVNALAYINLYELQQRLANAIS